jgi:hypothetical protein
MAFANSIFSVRVVRILTEETSYDLQTILNVQMLFDVHREISKDVCILYDRFYVIRSSHDLVSFSLIWLFFAVQKSDVVIPLSQIDNHKPFCSVCYNIRVQIDNHKAFCSVCYNIRVHLE